MQKNDQDSLVCRDNLRRIFLDFMQMSDFAEEPLIITEADGVWYKDINGNRILDGLSGIYVVNLGHNNPRIKEAIRKQIEAITFAPPLHSITLPAIKLAKLISEITPEELNTVKLLSGGSEATEAAMKLARQYHYQTGNPTKYKVISLYKGFHGTTMGSLSATGLKERKKFFEPSLPGFIHVFPPYCYRCPYHKKYPDCGIRCATIIGDVIEMEGPETVSSLIVEPIGNTGGIITPPPEYLPLLREICDQYNVFLIFDEIITGFGRTGNMFAAQTFGVTPDILCMGKGMGSGYTPLAAIAFQNKSAEAFWGEKGREFCEGHTYGANALSSAVGIACISEIQERKLCERAQRLGGYLRNKLEELKEFGVIGDIRGKGLLIGVEFVKNPKTNEPFGKEIEFGIKVGKIALKKGLLIRYATDWVAFAPPLIISEQEIDQMVKVFKDSLKEALISS